MREFIERNTEPCDDLSRRERLEGRQPVEIFLGLLELLFTPAAREIAQLRLH